MMETKRKDRSEPFTPYLRENEKDGGTRSQEAVRDRRWW